MAQQLLHDLQLCAGRSKQRRIGVTKSMPADSLRDAQLSRNRNDMVPHDLLGQERPATLADRTREYPALRRLIRRLPMPFAQSLDQIVVSWNRFLGGFGLANANNVLPDQPRYMN